VMMLKSIFHALMCYFINHQIQEIQKESWIMKKQMETEMITKSIILQANCYCTISTCSRDSIPMFHSEILGVNFDEEKSIFYKQCFITTIQ
jgi:hypothetical protein